MKKIYLYGKYSHLCALVDDADYEWLTQWRWCGQVRTRKIDTLVFARRGERRGGVYSNIPMSRVIMGCVPGDGIIVDHVDGDPLNNQRHNLRIATNSQNGFNMRKRVECTSVYKGVSLERATGRWKAQGRIDGKIKNLGRFSTEIEAARAYDEHARKYYGEYAKLNFHLES